MNLGEILFGVDHRVKDPARLARAIDEVLLSFDPEVARVFRARQQGHSYRQIAAELGLSEEQVRQREARAIRLLRKPDYGLRYM